VKLTKGTLKVIVTDPHAIMENPKRARAGGKIFIPPYVVFEHDSELKTTDVFYAFGVTGKTLRPRYNHTKFPFDWVPTKFRDYRVWIETTDELTLVNNYEDTNV
jgi:hypothetical protein